jgi:sulfatase modifying factor 1
MATVAGFRIAGNLVMVAEFEEFVKDVDYVTEAEKFGGAGVFDFENHEWVLVDSADFRFPFGRHKPRALPDHPVTQVSWNDATAYATRKHKRLPTRWELEQAARNGDQEYSWGNDLVVDGEYKANAWQGTFPFYNSADDGFLCDLMVCHGFRVLGRSSSTPQSSMVHIGFRCAKHI